MISPEKEEVAILNDQLHNLYLYKGKSSYVSSRRQWLAEGDQSTAYLFCLEQQEVQFHSINLQLTVY